MSLPDNKAGRLAGLDLSAHSLFAYGTLQFSEVLQALLGRVPKRDPAAATGWRAAQLPGRVYPGLVPAVDRSAQGVLLSGLTPTEWAILDAFEDDEYNLRLLHIPGHLDPISTYIWTAATEPVDWHAAQFTIGHLGRFVAHSVEWRRRL